MASVRARSDNGLLFFDFRFDGSRFREQSTLPDCPKNRQIMEKALRSIEDAIASKKFIYSQFFPNSKNASRFDSTAKASIDHFAAAHNQANAGSSLHRLTPTFKVFADTWIREMSPGWRKSTQSWMCTIINIHLIPAFGTKPVSAIKRHDVLDFRAYLCDPTVKRKRKLSNKTVNTIVRVLRSMLSEASDRYEFKNPGANLKRLKVPRKEIVPFSMEEVNLILSRVRTDFRPYLTVAFFTGMRPGELNGLHWRCVDLERKVIRVTQTYRHGEMDTTKTEGSQREIHISQPVLEALIDQQKVTGKRNTFVFCMPNGSPISDRNYAKRVWEPLLRNLHLARRVPYQTRHTCATLWMASGENPGWIARQLGHETTEMLFRVYSRWAPDLIGRDGSAFERVLMQRGAQQPAANDPVTTTVAATAAKS